MAVCEPHISNFHLHKIRLKHSFPNMLSNVEFRICIYFSNLLNGFILDKSSQYVAIHFNFEPSQFKFLAIFVHASCNITDRNPLWNQLIRLLNVSIPVIVMGDFNSILNTSEKLGGKPFIPSESFDLLILFNNPLWQTWVSQVASSLGVTIEMELIEFIKGWTEFLQIPGGCHLTLILQSLIFLGQLQITPLCCL